MRARHQATAPAAVHARQRIASFSSSFPRRCCPTVVVARSRPGAGPRSRPASSRNPCIHRDVQHQSLQFASSALSRRGSWSSRSPRVAVGARQLRGRIPGRGHPGGQPDGVPGGGVGTGAGAPDRLGWSKHGRCAALIGAERTGTAPPRPADSPFPQVSALAGPGWGPRTLCKSLSWDNSRVPAGFAFAPLTTRQVRRPLTARQVRGHRRARPASCGPNSPPMTTSMCSSPPTGSCTGAPTTAAAP